MDINILGSGVMGKQVAALLLLHGHDVLMWGRRGAQALTPEVERQRRIMQRKMETRAQPGALRIVDSLAALPSNLTIEALIEDLRIKRAALAELPYDPTGQGLFTNTSSLAPASIHPAARGLHFFNPIFAMKMVELSEPRDRLLPAERSLVEDLLQNGFDVIETHANAGYVGNYVLFREIGAVLRLIEEFGYAPEAIDRVLGHLGRSASVFDLIDLIGVDVCQRILSNLARTDASFYVSRTLGAAIEAGVLGNKNRTSIRIYLSGVAR